MLAAAGTMGFADQAQAGHRCCCPAACAPQACAVAPADHAAMPMSQAPGTQTYQSFSYEPGLQPQPVYMPTYRGTMSSTTWQMRQNAANFGKMR